MIRRTDTQQEREDEVFYRAAEHFSRTGRPAASKDIADQMGLSSATVRNIFARLEEQELICKLHTSGGRVLTLKGLRRYAGKLLQASRLDERTRAEIAGRWERGVSPEDILQTAGQILAELSACTALVISPKQSRPLQQIQFVRIDDGQTLVVLMFKDGTYENRMTDTPKDLTQDDLTRAANYLNANLENSTLAELRERVTQDLREIESEFGEITAALIEKGVRISLTDLPLEDGGHLILRGHVHLLDNARVQKDIENAQALLAYLEERKNTARILEKISPGDELQILVGTGEEHDSAPAGCSLILAPYKGPGERPLGVVGVVGTHPRIDYGRVIPIISHTSQMMSKWAKGPQ